MTYVNVCQLGWGARFAYSVNASALRLRRVFITTKLAFCISKHLPEILPLPLEISLERFQGFVFFFVWIENPQQLPPSLWERRSKVLNHEHQTKIQMMQRSQFRLESIFLRSRKLVQEIVVVESFRLCDHLFSTGIMQEQSVDLDQVQYCLPLSLRGTRDQREDMSFVKLEANDKCSKGTQRLADRGDGNVLH